MSYHLSEMNPLVVTADYGPGYTNKKWEFCKKQINKTMKQSIVVTLVVGFIVYTVIIGLYSLTPCTLEPNDVQNQNTNSNSEVSQVLPINATARRFIRNCITGEILGEAADPLELRSFDTTILDPSVVNESHQERQRSFQHVFATRAWGKGPLGDRNGFHASGNNICSYNLL